ncbi:MAG TPA: AAA family ATPase [Candidatus Onthocola stercoravium]|nr:AAA family ATPase [Candidatus Onthocola stercoravium]
MISFKEVKDKIEAMGYYATNELLYDTYNALALFNNSGINPGQDIFAICLEGPPGAGKTEFAKTYTKLSNELFKNVELVDYQCDATTGKTELFEDINISAAIRGDADNVNIPGKLIEAIKKVNSGKRVVLFIDEYDKAREETDAFLLQFLQSGKINSTQHGDLEIKDEYKGKLQVILCKNDMREELSGPLSRRIRIIRLDYMKPTLFYKVAHRLLIDEKDSPVNDGLLNLVSLMYEKAYANKEMYNRLPSCSEMLIAIEDADRVIKLANAPQSVIYNIIIRNMFKSPDDITTFESSLDRMKNQDESKLAALVKTMKINTEESEEELNLNSLIAEKVFVDESKKLVKKTQEMESLIETYKTKFAQMEQDRKKAISDEIKKIKLENGKLVSNTNVPNAIGNFEDESSHIKRGHNIFDLSDNNWTDVATLVRPHLSHNYVIGKLIDNASDLDIVIYENGILLQECGEQKLIVINDFDEKNNPQFRVLSSTPIVPSTFIQDIDNFTKFINECYASQPKTAKAVTDEALDMNDYRLNIDTLVYNESELPFDVIEDGVYHFEYKSDKSDQPDYLSMLKCENPEKALEKSKRIMSGQSKVLKK